MLHVSCSTGLEQDIAIPAATTGDTTQTLNDLPAGTVCTITEPTDGTTGATTTVTTDFAGNPATIPAGGTATIVVTNTYITAEVQPIAPVEPVNPTPPPPSVNPTPSPVLPSTGVPASLPTIGVIGLLLVATGSLLQLRRRRNRVR